jgi:hypothetical protein
MRYRTLLVLGGAVGMVGLAVGIVVDVLSGSDEVTEVVFIASGASIIVVLACIGFVAGWFGRERDDVVVITIGAGAVAAVAMVIAMVANGDVAIEPLIVAGGVAIVGGAAGAATWRIGDFICDGRDLPTAQRLVAPTSAEDHPGYPLWTTDAGPAIRSTLDQLADRVAPGEPVAGRAVGIVARLPRDMPVVVLLAGDRLAIQPVDINGAVNGELRLVLGTDIANVSTRSVQSDGTVRQINAYDDVITISWVDGSRTQLRLPYGTRGVGTTTGGSEAIRDWLMARSVIDR